MSRIFTSAFQQRSSTSPDNDPLLPLHATPSERSNSISMAKLSPRAHSAAASPSPPPSFYRDANANTAPAYPESRDHDSRSTSRAETLSPSPSRTKGRHVGKVQFAGPPPPIAASVMLPSRTALSTRNSTSSLNGHVSPSAKSTFIRSRRSSNGGVIHPLLGLERRERAIQKDLQELLDAQSAGLVQGFGGKADDSASEAGSSTPTYDSTRSRSGGRREGGVVPIRQPKRKSIGLRGARRGLLRDIGELAGIKGEEAGILAESIRQRDAVLQKVAVWEQSMQSFQKQLSAGSDDKRDDEEGRELVMLRNEEKAVDNEIREVEDRLLQMKARKKWLQERGREGENRREARLSSYRGALKEVEGEVKDFLRRPPVFLASTSSDIIKEPESFTTLPVNRRTLGMARELWTREISVLQSRQEAVETEKEALEQGAKLWSDSISLVLEFEDELRKQMAGNLQDVDMLHNQVKKMVGVIAVLEGSLKQAEDQGWNLLICALGAELEAFKEGQGILRQALGMIEGANGNSEDAKIDVEDSDVRNNGLEESNGADAGRKSLEREESSEDDGPPAELMIDNSHADGEGENSIE